MVSLFNKILFTLILFSIALASGAQPSGIHLIKKTLVGGEGSWDYLAVDSKNSRLYVSHQTQVEVLDLKSHKKVGVIPNTKGVHGIVVIPLLNRGVTTNGKANTVFIFDLKTLQVVSTLSTGDKPDALLYDAFSSRVFVFNNDGSSTTVIDPASGKVVQTVDLGGAPESGVSDEAGNIYVNLEDKNEIVVLNAKKLTIEKRFAVHPGEEPTGLALDKENRRLFSVCKNGMMLVLDANTGAIVAQLPIGKKADGVVFDPLLKFAISSNGEGTMTVVQEVSPTEFKVRETVATKAGAKTIAFDPVSHHVFLSVADVGEVPAATEADPKPKAPAIPGTFMVMEFGKD